MVCFEGVADRRMWWSNTEMNMFDGSPGWITKYMSIDMFEDIFCNLSYTDKNVFYVQWQIIPHVSDGRCMEFKHVKGF